MAISTYAELVTAIQAWLADRTDLAAYAPDFITLGEGIIAYGSEQVTPLRCREMETVLSITTTLGVGTLPTDYLGYRSVTDLASPRRNLSYVSPETSDLYYPERSSGNGDHFTIIGESIYAFPLTSNSVSLIYYKKIPALTALATTNWLLTKHPGIYLRAALLMAAEFIKDRTEMQTQAAFLSSLIKGWNEQSMVAAYSRASLMPRRTIA